MKVPKRLKEFLFDTIIIGILNCGITYGVMRKEIVSLKQQLRAPHTIEQKVEFNLPYSRGLGWTDPQNQRIYFKEDIDNDDWLDTYYIENPFSKDKFAMRLGVLGKDQLPKDY